VDGEGEALRAGRPGREVDRARAARLKIPEEPEDRGDRDADPQVQQGRARPPLSLRRARRLPGGGIVSRTLYKEAPGTLTLFAFDAGQQLSEHTAPFDAFVQVLDGAVELTIGGEKVPAKAGELVLMPAGVPHAVTARERFKMLLIMFRR
jgi:quercetin dioxygenase-like cupin family protein